MSMRCMTWAMDHAPVNDGTSVLVLYALADAAHDDGTHAFVGQEKMARRARKNVRTVQRKLVELEGAGIIRRGNQGLAADIPLHRRPVVYELNIARTWDDPDAEWHDKMSPQEANGVTKPKGWGDKTTPTGVTPVSYEPNTNQLLEPNTKDSSLGADAPTLSSDEQELARPDVNALCTLLADQIEARGSKRPTITVDWRKQTRLLIDVDGRRPDQIRNMLGWLAAGADEDAMFWQKNIRSMPKLRVQYDRLRELRLARGTTAARASASTTTTRVASAMDRAAKYRALAEQESTSNRLEITQ